MTGASKFRLSRAGFKVLRRGRRIAGTYFSLVVAPGVGDIAQFSCVVSKKVARDAVTRNRIKRVCREAVRKNISKANALLALAFYAKREAVVASYADIARDIQRLMARA